MRERETGRAYMEREIWRNGGRRAKECERGREEEKE